MPEPILNAASGASTDDWLVPCQFPGSPDPIISTVKNCRDGGGVQTGKPTPPSPPPEPPVEI